MVDADDEQLLSSGAAETLPLPNGERQRRVIWHRSAANDGPARDG